MKILPSKEDLIPMMIVSIATMFLVNKISALKSLVG